MAFDAKGNEGDQVKKSAPMMARYIFYFRLAEILISFSFYKWERGVRATHCIGDSQEN
jgi:hypothetical protein